MAEYLGEREIIFSAHALDRMQEMGVTKGEIISALRYPVAYYRSQKYNRPCYDGRRISIPVNDQTEGELVVITVLWTDKAVYDILGRRDLSHRRGR